MKKATRPPKNTSTWRDLQKNNPSMGTTRVARKRRLQILFRGALIACILLSATTGVTGLIYFKNKERVLPHASSPSDETTVLRFETDGVLTRAWAETYFADYLNQGIRSIDLSAVKSHAEAFGQIHEARVKRELPNHILLSIHEREPILRVRVRDENKRPETLLIARDGTVYSGINYPNESLRRLPGAVGLKLKRDGSEWLPVDGVSEVADFLDEARFQIPSLYRQWKIIDLTSWSEVNKVNSDLIRVSNGSTSDIVFSIHGFPQQLTRLAQIVTHTQRYQMGFPKRIDLSYGTEAVIDFN